MSNDDSGAAAAPVDVEEQFEPGRRQRRRRRWYVAGAVCTALTMAVIASFFVKLPYYVLAPGSVRPTQQFVTVEGRPTFSDPGIIGFTTVSVSEATVASAVFGWFDDSWELIERETYLGDRTDEDNRQLNLRLMDDSKRLAEVTALRQLGYEVTADGSGAVVAQVEPDSPADGVLQRGDTIVAVDGEPVAIADELVSMIQDRPPGTEVTLEVEPGPDGPREETVVLAARPDDETKAFLGTALGTRDLTFDLPFEVRIDSGDVGGPSAGLAFTLSVIDVLTPGSLTGANDVAVTGTIDLAGKVGPIGGMRQKVEGVKRSGVRYFIVPAAERDTAERYADGEVEIVGVETLEDALVALGELGGDVEVALGSRERVAS